MRTRGSSGWALHGGEGCWGVLASLPPLPLFKVCPCPLRACNLGKMDYGPEWGRDAGYCAQGGKVSTCLLKGWREEGGRVGLIASQVLKKWELKCTEQVDNKAASLQSQLTMLGSQKCCGRYSDHGEIVRAFLLGSVVCWPKCVTFCFDGGFALTSELFVAKSYEHSLWINHLKKMDEPVTGVVFRL